MDIATQSCDEGDEKKHTGNATESLTGAEKKWLGHRCCSKGNFVRYRSARFVRVGGRLRFAP